jgi:hypothetical protein
MQQPAASNPQVQQQVSTSRRSRPVSFAQHINRSLHPASRAGHARRITLADLTPAISTSAEKELWQELYFKHTHGSKTKWDAFLAEWNIKADQQAQQGMQNIKHKHMKHLKDYHQMVVKEVISRSSMLLMQTPIPPVVQPQHHHQQQQPTDMLQGWHTQMQEDPSSFVNGSMAAGPSGSAFAVGSAAANLAAASLDPLHQQWHGNIAGMGSIGSMAGAFPSHHFHMGLQFPAAAAAAAAAATQPGTTSYRFQRSLQHRMDRRHEQSAPAKRQKKFHKAHQCNSCWGLLAGNKGQHKKWPERCNVPCSVCSRSMEEHDKPCQKSAE